MNPIFQFDFVSIILFGLFSLLLFTLAVWLVKRIEVKPISLIGLGIAAFTMISFFILNHFLHLKSIAPDNYLYAEIIRDFWNSFSNSSLGVKFYSIINFLPIILCFKSPVVFIVFNVFYYLFGILFIGKSFELLANYWGIQVSKYFYVFLFLLSCLYPIALIIVPTLLREGSILFFNGISVYLIVKLILNPKWNWKAVLPIMAFVLLLFLQRPIGGLALIMGFGVTLILKQIITVGLRKSMKMLLLGSLVIIGTYYFVNMFYNIPISIAWLESFRNTQALNFGDNSYGGGLNWDSIFQVLVSISYLVLQYLFSPLPILISKSVMFAKIIPLADAIFILLGLVIILFHWRLSMIKWCLLFILILIGVPAIFEANIDGAFRHRMNAVVMMLPLLAFSLNRFIIQFQNYLNER